MEVGGESWVSELRGSVVVVDKVDPAGGSVPDLPAWWQRAQLLTVHITQVPAKHNIEEFNLFYLKKYIIYLLTYVIPCGEIMDNGIKDFLPVFDVIESSRSTQRVLGSTLQSNGA